MADDAVRERLSELIRRSGEGFAGLSRRLGRNPAYIQQFIRRGVPRRLSESDRRILASHFNVSEQLLGAPPVAIAPSGPRQAVGVPFLSPSAADDLFLVDPLMLERMPGGRPAAIAAHAIDGDAMAPTLVAGDRVLVDTGERATRDGVYVIASEGALLVKRLSVNPVTRRIAILSDNAAYPSFPDCDPDGIAIVGRVLWVGRTLP
jgi:hypothetical protein